MARFDPEKARKLWQRILSSGSQTAPRIADDIVESNALQKIAKEAREEAQVLGKGTSRAAKPASEPMEAAWREITPEQKPVSFWDAALKTVKENPKKTAGALTAAEVMRQMIENNGNNTEVPFRPEEPIKAKEPILPENYNELAQKEANEIEKSKEGPKTVKTEAPSPQGLAPDAEAKKEEVDEMTLAQERADRNALFAILGKAASQIGSGIATVGAGREVKADTEGFDQLLKMADRPVSQLQEKLKHDKLKSESMDEQAMRDPNSEISRIYHDVAIKAGLIKPGSPVAPAKVYEKFGLGNLLSTIEAGKARKDAAALSRETRAADMLERQRMRSEEEALKRQDKRKLITEEVEDRSRNLNDSIQMLQDTIDKYGTFELTGPQEEDMKRLVDTIATDMAKLADPNSVARPAEVELWKRNLAKVGGLQGLGMTNQTAKDILESFKGEVEKRRQHAYKVRGVSPDNEPTTKMGKEDNNFPRQVRKAGKVATVSNAAELKEAQEEGWQ